jgi:hypothetical protein
MYFYKPDKAYKHHQSQFISSVQDGAYFFKDPNFLKEMKFPDHDASSPEYVATRSNLQKVKLVDAVLNEQGQKVLDCPQDPSICSRFWDLIKHLVRPGSVAYCSGDGVGWAAIAMLGQGVDMIVTEKEYDHYVVMVDRYVIFQRCSYFLFF